MAIIRAADAEDVSSFSFGDDVGTSPEARAWPIAEDSAPSLPAPQEFAEPQRGQSHLYHLDLGSF